MAIQASIASSQRKYINDINDDRLLAETPAGPLLMPSPPPALPRAGLDLGGEPYSPGGGR